MKNYTVNESGCWIWNRAIGSHGYGKLGDGRLAHRVSYELHVGPIPDGMVICHRCDVRACINPAHLFVGTQKDNLQDAVKKGRAGRNPNSLANITKGRQPGYVSEKRAISFEQASKIRERYANGEKQTALAKEFGVRQTSISNLVRGRTYRSK